MNHMKILIIVTFAVILTACSPNEVIKDETVVETPNANNIADGNTKDESDDSTDVILESRLDFNKELSFVSMREVNNAALIGDPVGGIASQNSYVINDETLYLFYDAPLPTEDTELIVMEDKFNRDYLLDHKLHYFDVNHANLNSNLKNEHVDNYSRLFSSSEISIEHIENGNVSISVDGATYNLAPHETKEIERADAGIESKLIFKNYGQLNSSNNILYEEMNEENENEMAEEFRRSKVKDE